jgi:hypothetical protein
VKPLDLGFPEWDVIRAWAQRVNPSGELPPTVDVQELAEQVGQKLFNSPGSQAYLARCRALGDVGTHIHTPADVFGERAFRLGGMCLAPDRLMSAESIPRADRVRVALRGMMARPYLWTDRCYQIARETPVPKHVISRATLPTPQMWWTWETAYTAYDSSIDGREIGSLDAMMLSDEVEGFSVFHIGQSEDDEHISVQGFGFRYGTTFPDDYSEAHREAAGQILSLLAFLNSPYIPKRTERLDRASRRALERYDHSVHVEDAVTFVDLRTPVSVKGSDPESRDVEWKHRWIVRGHNRAQWYPSEEAHHVIYIAPYLKGPEDAPLLEHAYRVKR